MAKNLMAKTQQRAISSALALVFPSKKRHTVNLAVSCRPVRLSRPVFFGLLSMRFLGKYLLSICLAIAGWSNAGWAQVDPLPVIDDQLRRDFPEVQSISAAQLQALLERGPNPILLDIRTADEFAVSHLKGAIRVDPDADLADVLRVTGPVLKSRDVIVYCSVGVRSTELASRLRIGLKANGASRVSNLSQGIFGWHNAGRSLTRAGVPISYIHPYDAKWGQLLEQKNLIRYAPNGSSQSPAPRTPVWMLIALFSALMVSAIFYYLWQRRA
jgi:rhodanese-related sulfurtransferase